MGPEQQAEEGSPELGKGEGLTLKPCPGEEGMMRRSSKDQENLGQ